MGARPTSRGGELVRARRIAGKAARSLVTYRPSGVGGLRRIRGSLKLLPCGCRSRNRRRSASRPRVPNSCSPAAGDGDEGQGCHASGPRRSSSSERAIHGLERVAAGGRLQDSVTKSARARENAGACHAGDGRRAGNNDCCGGRSSLPTRLRRRRQPPLKRGDWRPLLVLLRPGGNAGAAQRPVTRRGLGVHGEPTAPVAGRFLGAFRLI
jgi:hypothetical protein